MSVPRTPDAFLTDFEAERAKKQLSKKDPASSRKEFLAMLAASAFGPREKKRLSDALEFLETHTPPDKGHYVAHPLRVARLVWLYEPGCDADMLALAILHNILEVGRVDTTELAQRFGTWVASGCERFEVDREKQKGGDSAYLKAFYSALAQDRRLLLIKLFDKWDNTLGVYHNPSKELRRAYLDEIEQWLLPLVGGEDRRLGESFASLIAQTRSA